MDSRQRRDALFSGIISHQNVMIANAYIHCNYFLKYLTGFPLLPSAGTEGSQEEARSFRERLGCPPRSSRTNCCHRSRTQVFILEREQDYCYCWLLTLIFVVVSVRWIITTRLRLTPAVSLFATSGIDWDH
jgi:hypothetical protein